MIGYCPKPVQETTASLRSSLVRAVLSAVFVAAFLAIGVLTATAATAAEEDVADEIVFYKETGTVHYYDMKASGSLGSSILSSPAYSTGWTSIVGADVDGQGQDEVFFYRATDGAYRVYNIKSNASLGGPMQSGNMSAGWTSITALDLEGDGSDEILFYRATDGTFKYYDLKPDGSLGSLIRAGVGYTLGWTSIAGIDLDADGQDEILFYNKDNGVYRYYDITGSASLGLPIRDGGDYSLGWTSVTPINIDGDLQDEVLFYRSSDGLFAYYNINSSASLGSPIQSGTGYSAGWTSISALNLHGDQPIERISRFTTFFDCCQNRVTNIRLMASQVNGTVVLPGETFSIDQLIGPRTAAKGYLPAPYLQDGEGQCCAVGGGVSQFGTTIHNAVFWGGLDVVDYRPHTGWISRYPLGIEATLVYRAIDYKFTNDTPTPLTIRTSSTSTSVTVELWGNQGGWRVTGFHPRGARSSSISVLDQGGANAKRVSARVTGSAPGLVRVDRTLRRGVSSSTETWWWNYVS